MRPRSSSLRSATGSGPISASFPEAWADTRRPDRGDGRTGRGHRARRRRRASRRRSKPSPGRLRNASGGRMPTSRTGYRSRPRSPQGAIVHRPCGHRAGIRAEDRARGCGRAPGPTRRAPAAVARRAGDRTRPRRPRARPPPRAAHASSLRRERVVGGQDVARGRRRRRRPRRHRLRPRLRDPRRRARRARCGDAGGGALRRPAGRARAARVRGGRAAGGGDGPRAVPGARA